MTPALVMSIVRVLLALALYGFLGALLWMLWRDVRAAGQARLTRSRPLGRLVITETALPGLALGTTFPLLTITSLGRAPTNTVPLPDDTASLEHALLHLRDGQWWLEDLGSRNGTQLNDSLLTASAPTPVMAGDVVGVGRTKLKLELGDS
jgi:pSer/pThr/pTyr-binding forkhead associated (FHA) protein